MPKDITLSDGQVVKKPSKTGETLLSVLSVLGDIGGKIIFGNDVGLGQPFALGAQFMKNKREGKQMMEILGETPHTAPIKDLIEQGMAVGEQGGLLNQGNAAGMPTTIAQDGSGSTQIPGVGVGQPEPTAIAPGASQQQIPNPIAPGQPIDYQSDAFMRRVAAVDPELAQKVLQSRMIGAENPLMDQLRLMTMAANLQNMETPAMKREAQYQDRKSLTEERIALQRDAQTAAREEARQIKREEWTPKEQEQFNVINDGLASTDFVMDKLNSGFEPSMIKGVLGENKFTAAIAQRMGIAGAEDMATMKQMVQNIFKAVKANSGVQYGMKELVKMEASMPNTMDTKEAYVAATRTAQRMLMWSKYQRALAKSRIAKSHIPYESIGISRAQMEAFVDLNEQLSATSRGKAVNIDGIFNDKRNLPLIESIGLK